MHLPALVQNKPSSVWIVVKGKGKPHLCWYLVLYIVNYFGNSEEQRIYIRVYAYVFINMYTRMYLERNKKVSFDIHLSPVLRIYSFKYLYIETVD